MVIQAVPHLQDGPPNANQSPQHQLGQEVGSLLEEILLPNIGIRNRKARNPPANFGTCVSDTPHCFAKKRKISSEPFRADGDTNERKQKLKSCINLITCNSSYWKVCPSFRNNSGNRYIPCVKPSSTYLERYRTNCRKELPAANINKNNDILSKTSREKRAGCVVRSYRVPTIISVQKDSCHSFLRRQVSEPTYHSFITEAYQSRKVPILLKDSQPPGTAVSRQVVIPFNCKSQDEPSSFSTSHFNIRKNSFKERQAVGSKSRVLKLPTAKRRSVFEEEELSNGDRIQEIESSHIDGIVHQEACESQEHFSIEFRRTDSIVLPDPVPGCFSNNNANAAKKQFFSTGGIIGSCSSYHFIEEDPGETFPELRLDRLSDPTSTKRETNSNLDSSNSISLKTNFVCCHNSDFPTSIQQVDRNLITTPSDKCCENKSSSCNYNFRSVICSLPYCVNCVKWHKSQEESVRILYKIASIEECSYCRKSSPNCYNPYELRFSQNGDNLKSGRENSTNFIQNEMGCIQSIAKAKVAPDRYHNHCVIVEEIQAAIDKVPTEIEEKSPIVLRYRTPYFRASAHVIVPPITKKETWTIGWIQACDSMKFINEYGDMGSSSWEIPALKERRIPAVSDSDGVSYPWYGNTTEIASIDGPTDTSRSLTLRMNDNFHPSVTWDIPVSEGSEAHLTHIVRDQSFTTWLAAVNQTTGRLEVLRTVKWHFYLEIDVDPSKELGKRAHVVSPPVQQQPIIITNNDKPVYLSTVHNDVGRSENMSDRRFRLDRKASIGGDNNSNNHSNYIPKSALVRPSANNAQTLIWRPTRDVPVIVVPPKEVYKENNEVVWFTRTPSTHRSENNIRILTHKEMSRYKEPGEC